MKILRKGKIPGKTKRWFVSRCPECDTVVTFAEDDPQVSVVAERRLDGYIAISYNCPICNEQVVTTFHASDAIILPEGEEPNPDLSMLDI